MDSQLTTETMPDLLDLKKRVDSHLSRREKTLKQTAEIIRKFLHNDLTDIYDLEEVQSEAEMILDAMNVRGRVLESMIDNNHTITHVIWTNYLKHNKINICKDKKISALKETQDLIEKLHINHMEIS